MPRVRDTVLLTGWLFADLLLALMVIFFAAVPGKPPPPIPVLTTNLTSLDPNNKVACTGTISNFFSCKIMLGESTTSSGDVDWSVSANFASIGSKVSFSPSSGHLSPGGTTRVIISSIPCQNDSFTFTGLSGTRNTVPISVLWRCAEHLDFKFQSFTLTMQDPGVFLSGSSLDNDIKRQIMNQPILKGRDVGLAIVSAGAPTNGDIAQAQQVSAKICQIFQTLNHPGQPFERAAYYENLYLLGGDSHIVNVDAYLFA